MEKHRQRSVLQGNREQMGSTQQSENNHIIKTKSIKRDVGIADQQNVGKHVRHDSIKLISKA